MIAAHSFLHLSEPTFAAIVVALIGAISVWQGKRGRRVESKIDEALVSQQTGNDKRLGETVHDIAQTQELLSAQIHTNTRELVTVAEAQVTLGARFDAHLSQSVVAQAEILENQAEILEKLNP